MRNTYPLAFFDLHTQESPVDVTPAPTTVHHIIVVDCSGSMRDSLGQLRNHLKSKLLELASNGDNTITLIWFSSRGDFGVAFEAVKVSTLDNLVGVHHIIDRQLVSRGGTGFKEPIEQATRIAKKLKGSGAINFFFLSDGMENYWPKSDVYAAVDALREHTASATVVEYGTWADRQMLLTMAEKLGGNHTYSASFEDYRVVVEQAISTPMMLSAKPMTLEGMEAVHGGIAIAHLADKSAVALEVRGRDVLCPVGTTHVSWLTRRDDTVEPAAVGQKAGLDTIYHVAAAFALRGDAQVARSALGVTDDVELIDIYSAAFGKEAVWAFAQKARERAALSEDEQKLVRRELGYMPPPDAVTIPSLLQTLDTYNASVLDPEVGYKRIGRSKVDANLRLTPEEAVELDRLSSLLKGEKDLAKISELTAQIDALTNKPAPLRFVDEASEGDRYFPVSDIVLNEDRPNISLRVRRVGSVDISARIPESLKGQLPEQFPTYVWRTYTLVRDGFVNMESLTVRVPVASAHSVESWILAAATGRRLRDDAYTTPVYQPDGSLEVTFFLKKIPLINLKDLEKPSARDVADRYAELLEYQAQAKVFKDKLSELRPEKSLNFAALYGEEGAAFLASIGITDGGFHPRVLQAESIDTYVAKVLELKAKGFSSLPSVSKVKAQIEAKKVPPVSQLMASAVAAVEGITSADEVEAMAQTARGEVRRLQRELARLKYPALVGNAWYFNSFDEKTIELKFPNHPLSTELTFELKEFVERI